MMRGEIEEEHLVHYRHLSRGSWNELFRARSSRQRAASVSFASVGWNPDSGRKGWLMQTIPEGSSHHRI